MLSSNKNDLRIKLRVCKMDGRGAKVNCQVLHQDEEVSMFAQKCIYFVALALWI